MMEIPKVLSTEDDLERALASPYPALVEMMARLDGDIMVLGASGKMGPSLARLAVAACKQAGGSKRVFGVSRFTDKAQREGLERAGVETIVCDLGDTEHVERLPKIKNIVFMAGRKFGAVGSEALTWSANTVAPANVARAFPTSRIVAFSTGCVYPLVPPAHGGSVETDPSAPVGEYACSCLERERIFQQYSEQEGTPVLLFRLNYATDLRYGVIVDIALDAFAGRPVDIAVDSFNIIWQGDANNRALLCLEHVNSPAAILNVTGPDILRVQDVAEEFGRIFHKNVGYTGVNSGVAYLSNPARSVELFGPPQISVAQLIEWVAHWIARGGRLLGKPTHFQVTDGQFLTQDNPSQE
jgi:nucleoside-diphosphate-sugar epimerase